MASKDKLQPYDSRETIRGAIRTMDGILACLTHRKTRATVFGAISGLKCILNELDFGKEKTDRLRNQSKLKDEKSRSAATNAMNQWTDDGDRIILTSAMSDFDIGLELGRSRNAVASRRKRLLKSKQVIL